MPTPKGNQLLIRVYATTVNRTDCHVLLGKPYFMRLFTGLVKPRLASTGSDFVGQIVAVGNAVRNFSPGERVMGFGGVFGCGSHRQFIVFAETRPLIRIPDNLSYEEAVACIEGPLYAYGNLRLNIQPGDKVLVIGATGAIGSSLVQLLKFIGAHITATCRQKDMELVKSLGADTIIDYTTNNFTKTHATYDFIFDAVGKSSYAACKALLKPKGVYNSAHPSLAQTILTALKGGKREVFLPIPDFKAGLRFITPLIIEGRFRPVIDRKYPLKDIVEAYHYVATAQKVGNVLLIMDGGM